MSGTVFYYLSKMRSEHSNDRSTDPYGTYSSKSTSSIPSLADQRRIISSHVPVDVSDVEFVVTIVVDDDCDRTSIIALKMFVVNG